MRLVYASRALRDIDGILERVHERSPKGAKNVSLAIEHTIAICAAGPYTGTKTDEPSLYPCFRDFGRGCGSIGL
jgi:plasmid stabilization system protein ParE